MSVLLRDLLAAGSMAYHHEHVVLVIPQEPTLAWDALLCLQPSFAVTYLNGDLRCVVCTQLNAVSRCPCVALHVF